MIGVDFVKANIAAYESYKGNFDAMYVDAYMIPAYMKDGFTMPPKGNKRIITFDEAYACVSKTGIVVVTLKEVHDLYHDEYIGNLRIGISSHKGAFLVF